MARLVARLLVRSFPRLRRVRLGIDWGGEDGLLCYAVEGERVRIRVNPELRPAPAAALEGGLVHELCHIDADLRLGRFARELAWRRYLESSRWRRHEERATERRALELGYAPQLLAFIRFARRLGYSFSREDGLLYAEILRAVRPR